MCSRASSSNSNEVSAFRLKIDVFCPMVSKKYTDDAVSTAITVIVSTD